MNRIEINVITGETEVIELTTEEVAQAQAKQSELNAIQSEITAKEQATKEIKDSALAKLATLGLTQDEIKALVG